MAGRFAYFMIAGAAIVGGMIMQGDLRSAVGLAQGEGWAESDRSIDRAVDRAVDRSVDRTIDRSDRGVDRAIDRAATDADPEAKRALARAVAELVRAEGSLALIEIGDEAPAAELAAARQRRDAAKQTVDRLADSVETQSRTDRDELRREIRDDVREGIRDAIRG